MTLVTEVTVVTVVTVVTLVIVATGKTEVTKNIVTKHIYTHICRIKKNCEIFFFTKTFRTERIL